MDAGQAVRSVSFSEGYVSHMTCFFFCKCMVTLVIRHGKIEHLKVSAANMKNCLNVCSLHLKSTPLKTNMEPEKGTSKHQPNPPTFWFHNKFPGVYDGGMVATIGY